MVQNGRFGEGYDKRKEKKVQRVMEKKVVVMETEGGLEEEVTTGVLEVPTEEETARVFEQLTNMMEGRKRRVQKKEHRRPREDEVV